MSRPAGFAAVSLGCAASFVAAVDLSRAVRPALLLDPETSWAFPRLLLGLAVIAAAAIAGGTSAALLLLWSRRASASAPLPALPFSRDALRLLFAAAVLAGAVFRFVDLARVPAWLWEDDISLVAPSLALRGAPGDFADSVRPVTYGVSSPYGSVGVLYMEIFRVILKICGTTVFGVRLVSAASGVLSLFTAAWLGRALLPRGGGTLAALILAGLRWHLILSRWGWNMILLAPLVDAAALLALRARRRSSLGAAAAAGIVMGLSAHVYLSAWIAAAAFFLFLLWPGNGGAAAARVGRASLYLACVALAAAPLLLFHEGRVFPYFRRVEQHNVLGEMRLTRSWTPPLYAAADAALAPWFLSDPKPRHDLPGRSRLGWVLGAAVAVALARALVVWKEDLSVLLIAQAAAAFVAAVAGGQSGLPNGSRFGYLSDTAAVAASGGVLWFLGRLPQGWRRAGALGAVGALAVLSLRGFGDMERWSAAPQTFASFSGQDTLIGQAAARWDRFGTVVIAPALGHPPDEVSGGTIGSVRRYRLDPEEGRQRAFLGNPSLRGRSFRIVAPHEGVSPGERRVEIVQDPWGRCWAAVVGAKRS